MPEPRVQTLAALLAGLALALCCTTEPLAALAQSRSERAILERVNALRTQQHLTPLRNDADLARVALAHARDMAREGYLDHIDREGQNPLQRAQAAGVRGVMLLAENIAASDLRTNRLDAVFRGWLDSHSHRENLLNPAFSETGIGIADASDGTRIYVELFATFDRSGVGLEIGRPRQGRLDVPIVPPDRHRLGGIEAGRNLQIAKRQSARLKGARSPHEEQDLSGNGGIRPEAGPALRDQKVRIELQILRGASAEEK